MSVPINHHYLPSSFTKRWNGLDGKVVEYRRANGKLIIKSKAPTATGFERNLYTDTSQTEPLKKQALELGLMQLVDNPVSTVVTELIAIRKIPSDYPMRAEFLRFVLSLIYRSPSMIARLGEKIEEAKSKEILVLARQFFEDQKIGMSGVLFDDWYRTQELPSGPMRKELLENLIKDSQSVMPRLHSMEWQVLEVVDDDGFLTGDFPLVISESLTERNSFLLLAISPNDLFVAANDNALIESLAGQPQKALREAYNDAVAKQCREVLIAKNNNLTHFIKERFGVTELEISRLGIPRWRI